MPVQKNETADAPEVDAQAVAAPSTPSGLDVVARILALESVASRFFAFEYREALEGHRAALGIVSDGDAGSTGA